MFRTRAVLEALVIGAMLFATAVKAQEYPKRQPIKIVVAVPAGGLTDAVARITADFLQRRMGQAVVVESRPGGSSTIGADFVMRSPADGYTIFLAGAEQPVIAAIRRSMPYKIEDFTYLVRPFTTTPLIMVGPKSPFASTTDLIAYMKANPGKLSYGTSGIGAIGHVGSVMFENAAGVKGLHVPYAGIAPVYNDLLAGHIDFTVGGTPGFPEGLKVIGSSGTTRSAAYPSIPNLDEIGVKNAGWDLWFGFLAPPRMSKDLVDRLTAELLAVVKDPEAIERYKLLMKTAPDETPLVGDAFRKRALDEQKAWKAIAERERISIE